MNKYIKHVYVRDLWNVVWGILIWICLFGWAQNIYKVALISSDPISSEFIMRMIGIPFVPFGIIFGYF